MIHSDRWNPLGGNEDITDIYKIISNGDNEYNPNWDKQKVEKQVIKPISKAKPKKEGI